MAAIPPATRATRLHHFCGGLMEACWLAAVVLVPLAYNPHGVAAFQPFKMAVVRLIALILATAWAVRLAGGGGGFSFAGKRPAGLNALLLGVAGLALAQVFSTILSIDPMQSLWGFSPMRWGFVSFLAELVIFAAVATQLRSAAQLDRLTAAIILPTIPLGFFALAQSFGFDPLSLDYKSAEEQLSAVSLAGHKISLGAHLAMVIPFTLARIIEVFQRPGTGRRIFPVTVYGTILLLQLAAVVLAKGRGPLLGLLAGLAALLVAWAALENSRKMLRWGLATVLGAVLFLGTLSMPHGPLAALTHWPVLKRFSSALPVGQTADPFRVSLWNRAPDVVLAKTPFILPDGHPDRSPRLRTATGFGQETLQGVLPRYWTWIDPQRRLEKSFHNLFWDSWFSFGALGLGALVLVFASGLWLAFRVVGFSPGKTEAGLGLLAAAAVSAVLVTRFGPGFFGLGVQAGLAAGFVLALAARIVASREKNEPSSQDPRLALPAIAAGAALVAHLVETAFAFQVAATSLLFWICLGLLAAHAHSTTVSWTSQSESARPWALPLLAGIVMTALIFAFVHLDFAQAMSWQEILSVSLTRMRHTRAASHLVPLVVLTSLVLLAALVAAESARCGDCRGAAFRRTLLAAGGLAVGYAVGKAIHLAALGPLPGKSVPVVEIIGQAIRAEWLVTGFLLWAGVLVGLLGWLCCREGSAELARSSRREIFTAALLAAGALGVSYPVALRFTLADTALAAGDLRLSSPDLRTRQTAPAVFARAIRHDPWASEYRLRLADACQNLAAATDVRTGESYLDQAAANLAIGDRISPLSPASYALARLAMLRALAARQPEEKHRFAQEAQRHFERALRADPASDQMWVESAVVAGELLHDHAAAAEKMRATGHTVSARAAENWAEAYAGWSVHVGHPILSRAYAERGIFLYQRALEATFESRGSKFPLLIGQGTLHRNLRQFPEALAAFQAAAALPHRSDSWRADAMLAFTFADLEDRRAALVHSVKAMREAPPAAQEALRELLGQLQR